MTVAVRAGELYIGKSDGEAIFTINGAMTRVPIVECDWEGFAVTTFGAIASFLKIPPAGDTVKIRYAEGRLKIDSLSLSAKWAGAPDWIAAMATEAHLLDIHERKTLLYCPRCGKKKGEPVDITARGWPEAVPANSPLSREYANRRCAVCGHAWCELAST